MKNLTDFDTKNAIEIPEDLLMDQMGLDRYLLDDACVLYQGRFWLNYHALHSMISDGLSNDSTLSLLLIDFESRFNSGKTK